MDSFEAEFELLFDLFAQFQSLNQDDKNKAFISLISDFEFCNSLLQLINDDCLKKNTDKKNRFLKKADEYLSKNPPNLLPSLIEICKIYKVDFEKSHRLISTNQYSLFFAYLFNFEYLMDDYPSNSTS